MEYCYLLSGFARACVKFLILNAACLSAVQVSAEEASLDINSKWLAPHEVKHLKFPFSPSRAIVNPLSPKLESFDSSKICAGCHAEISKQWQGSVMAHAWKDPIYRALLKRASKATGGKTDNFCIGCHSPIGMVTKSIVSLDVNDENIPGVDCETCHSITSRTGLDNGAYLLVKQKDANIKYGPRKDGRSPFHQTAYSELHTRSDFCSVCHNVTHPFNSVAVERTYDEWLDSPYSEQGIECQDCHMSQQKDEAGGAIKSATMGKPRVSIAGHFFAGANAVLMDHFGFPDQAKRNIKMLRSAATVELISPPVVAQPDDLVTVTYKVSNVGAGHKLPTGFPEGREMWLDFRVRDGNGKQIFRSGAIKDGKTEPGTQNFKALMGDMNGNIVETNVWEVAIVLSDNRIPPMGYANVDYTFQVPDKVQGPLYLMAVLKYWPFSQHMADELLGEGKMKVKPVRMAETETIIPVAGVDSLAIKQKPPALSTR